MSLLLGTRVRRRRRRRRRRGGSSGAAATAAGRSCRRGKKRDTKNTSLRSRRRGTRRGKIYNRAITNVIVYLVLNDDDEHEPVSAHCSLLGGLQSPCSAVFVAVRVTAATDTAAALLLCRHGHKRVHPHASLPHFGDPIASRTRQLKSLPPSPSFRALPRSLAHLLSHGDTRGD